MKIALVHSFYLSSAPSGENNAVTRQAAALAEAGHEVTVVARRSDDFINQKLYKYRSAWTVATGAGPDPTELLNEFQPDIVHVHNLFPNWSTNWLKRLDFPVVATVHNFRPVCAAGTLLREGKFCDLCPTKGSGHAVKHSCYQASRLATIPLAIASRKGGPSPVLDRADAVVFLSDRTKTLYESFGLNLAEKSFVIPNFVGRSDFGPQSSNVSETQRWIFVGRLSEEKGIVPLIRHWPNDIPLDIVGNGPEEIRCEEEAEGKTIVFHGQLDPKEVKVLLQNARGLVFPSICSENSPLVYLESLSNGLPTLALEGNSVADDVKLFGTGVAIPSLENLLAGIQNLEGRHEDYSLAAIRRFENRYSAPVWLSDIERVYEQAIQTAN